MRRSPVLSGLLLAAAVAQAGAQEPLRLDVAGAIHRARQAHPALIDARERSAATRARAGGSRAAYLPQVAVDWGVVRTDDPVAVFGTKLRQGVFAAPDLALDALNLPAPITNTSLGLTVEQPLIAPAAWLGRRAALAGADAASLFEDRAGQQVAYDAIRAYFGAQLAAARVAVMDSQLVAARRMLDQVRALRREGVVTAVDEHLALARLSELEAGRANVAAERLAATDRLLALLGQEPGSPVELVEPLAPPADPAVTAASADRLDVAGLEAALRAFDANVDRVRAQWLPSVGAFGNLAWNQTNLGALAGPRRWTAGVMVRWNVFRGLADVADLDHARAERLAAADRLAAARRDAAAEVRAAEARVDAAGTAVAAAGRALEHAAAAVRVAEARYAGGVATITELLAVRASEAAQRLNRLEALYQTRLARAALTLALGGTPE